MVLAAGHFDGAKCPQMIRNELRIQEFESPRFEPSDEMDQRDLGRVARPVDHALAEESAAKGNAVESAHEIVPLVDFEAVAMPPLVELAIERADSSVDPGTRTARPGLGAGLEHRIEVALDGHGEMVGAHGPCEPRRNVKAVKRDDAALLP